MSKTGNGKALLKSFGIDVVVGVFLVAGLWTVSNGLLLIYGAVYKSYSLPEPSVLGNTIFWFIEGAFFLYLAVETRKYRRIKLG